MLYLVSESSNRRAFWGYTLGRKFVVRNSRIRARRKWNRNGQLGRIEVGSAGSLMAGSNGEQRAANGEWRTWNEDKQMAVVGEEDGCAIEFCLSACLFLSF